MGYWNLEAWKVDNTGDSIELNDTDREHIAELIKEGYTSGEVIDGDNEGEE